MVGKNPQVSATSRLVLVTDAPLAEPIQPSATWTAGFGTATRGTGRQPGPSGVRLPPTQV